MKNVIEFVADNWPTISAVLYEVVIRVVPTGKNLSIIDNVFKVVSFLVKNRRKPKPTDITPDGSENAKINSVVVDRFKHIIPVIALLCLGSYGVLGQTNLTGKSVRFYNADSLTVRTEVTGLELMYDSVGALYYNDQASPAKFRIFYNHAWHDLIGASGGGGGTNIYNSDGALTSERTLTGAFGLTFEPTEFSVEASGDFNIYAGVEIDMYSEAGASFNSEGDVALNSYSGNITAITGNRIRLLSGEGIETGPLLDISGTDARAYMKIGDVVTETTPYGHITLTETSINIFSSGAAPSGEYAHIELDNVTGNLEAQASNNLNLQAEAGMNFYAVQGQMSFLSGDNSMLFDPGADYGAVTITAVSQNGTNSNQITLNADNVTNSGSIDINSASGINLTLTRPLIVNSSAGTAGQFLRSGGASAPPTWAAATATITADNGLTANTGSNTRLGGTLIQNTDVIAGGSFDLSLGTTASGLDNFNVYADNGIFLSEPTGFAYMQLSSTGNVAMQLGLSGGTNNEVFISNGSQTNLNTSAILRIFKNNLLATNDTISIVHNSYVQVSGGDGTRGYGNGINFAAENNTTGGNENIGQLAFTYKDATSGSEDTRFVIKLLDNSVNVTSFEVWEDATNNNTRIKVGTLPTSCTGLSTGELANVAGVLNVCP